MRIHGPVAISAFVILALACGSTHNSGFEDSDGGAGASGDGGVGLNGQDAGVVSCNPQSANAVACACTAVGATQGCYSGDPGTRGVGTCKDGTQTCQRSGESLTWGPCVGETDPASEDCSSTTDTNCNGKTGCSDPTCATDPACNTGCTDGQTRPCYTGPSGTENVGVCKDGTQTCVGGSWPSTCDGQSLPGSENCCDALDHNCNGLPGCFDFFSCLTASCCQEQCQSPLDSGCVCPQGSGDEMTCPDGDHDVHKGGFPGTDECCPCNDCSDINCCGNPACAGSSTCSGLNCAPLPASCKGQVSADCDDFPEDCDEPCCKCRDCPP